MFTVRIRNTDPSSPLKLHWFPLAFVCLYYLSLKASFLSFIIPFPTPASNLKTVLWIYTHANPPVLLFSPSGFPTHHQSLALRSHLRPRKRTLHCVPYGGLYLSVPRQERLLCLSHGTACVQLRSAVWPMYTRRAENGQRSTPAPLAQQSAALF